MTIILLVISGLYAIMTLALWWGWGGVWWSFTPPSTPITAEYNSTIPFSVIIPVRNEAENLPHLLQDLAKQTYPHFEVIVADDSSTDNTVAVVRQLADGLPYTLTLLPLSDERTGAPKKRAIAQSIRIAKGDLILTTDGDCRVGPDWVLSFATFYAEHQPKMITGPVTFTSELSSLPGQNNKDDSSPNELSSWQTVFANLQTVEFASLIGSGAATLKLGMPTMCNGANLCYEKRVFNEVNGFAGIDHVASGDDELLMHKIAKQYASGVRFLKNPAAIVHTAPHASWGAFYNQRKRWASKWRAYDSWQPSALAVFVFVSNMAPVFSVIGYIAGVISGPMALLIVGLKTAPEFLFLRAVLRFLQKNRAVRWIPITQLVYPFYVLFFGLAAQKKGFVWKGRALK
jgi:cellulose synthase/poly-beta-1,6-N-acetylglucosamine synthase-like glycosyltransferase